MITRIPLSQVSAQGVNVTLAGQPCTILLRQLGGLQYMSLSVNGDVIFTNVLLVDRSPVVRAKYKGFIGEIAAVDTQGDSAPQYTGWGTRWVLAFNDAA